MKRDIVRDLLALSFLPIFVCMIFPTDSQWWVPLWNMLCVHMGWHGSYMP